MKLKTKLLTFLAPAAAIVSFVPTVALTSCGGGGQTGERTNKISFTQTGAIINYGSTFSINMTLDHVLASGQKITGLVTYFFGKTGGQYLWVESVIAHGTTATVNFKYDTAPSKEDVDQFTVKFTGKTGSTTDWTSVVSNIKATYSKP